MIKLLVALAAFATARALPSAPSEWLGMYSRGLRTTRASVGVGRELIDRIRILLETPSHGRGNGFPALSLSLLKLPECGRVGGAVSAVTCGGAEGA